MKPLFAAALLILAALIVQTLRPTHAAAPDSAATYTQGTLHVTIPYHATEPGPGTLRLDVLDPDDAILTHSERRLALAEGDAVWQADLKLPHPMKTEDLVWHRVRYRFSYDAPNVAPIQSTDSISQILRTPVLHILAQQSYLTGADAAVRVIVTDTHNDAVPGPATLRIDLLPPNQRPKPLYSGPVNSRGTAAAQFRFPAGLTGSFPVRYTVDTPIGSTEFTQQVRLEDKAAILLTTEKPIYQPGQTIHVRGLALDRGRHEATAGRTLTFELEDSRGNKVFKKATQTSRYGIASAEFALADEVNLGTYHLRAIMDQNTANLALNVERYVLPKFKVAIELPTRNTHGYRPGDHVTGTVRANYFFGKPVDRAEITVKATGLDVAQFEAGAIHGTTDADGAYRFDIQLPAYFAGKPLTQGAARVLLEATVKDAAGHNETRGEPITVSQSPLIIAAIPEGGTLIPNLENQLFVLASYADGQPATAEIKLLNQTATTDAGGVAVVKFKPGARVEPLTIEARDRAGNHARTVVNLDSRSGADQVLLRTEQAVYRAGDRILLKLFSTKERGAAYLDIVKNGQTVLTRDLDLVNGQAELTLTATADLAGTLDVNAYIFRRDARPVADHRLVFVQPADELKIEATADAPSYKPGDDARIRFRVTNARGEGVQAALGLQVVDEAVFALAEKQPGFAKVFFYLEQEALKPRYEIHSIGMPEAVETAANAERGRAARALFAATEIVNGNKFETEAGRSVPMTKYAEYGARYQTRFVEQGRYALLHKPSHPRDAWDTELRIEKQPWSAQQHLVRSAGPDKRFDTGDDLYAYFEVRARKSVARPTAGPSKIDLQIEHDRGPFNGRAQISGIVVDQRGGAIEGARISVTRAGGTGPRTAVADGVGEFTISAIEPGDYEVQVSTVYETITRNIALAARDRAVFLVGLAHEPDSTVVVAMPQMTRFRDFRQQGQQGQQAGMGGGGGVVGGVPGGVLGGIIGGVRQLAMPAAVPLPVAKREFVADIKEVDAVSTLTVRNEAAAPRTRSYFPEALYINPEIITDPDGRATISIPLADSITTWRMAMLASTTRGALGSAASSIKVFQDFFVDLDLPVTLTQGDRVSLPVAVYNYSGAPGQAALELKPADWFSLMQDVSSKTVNVESNRVGTASFTLQANRIGKFKLTLSASMKGSAKRGDSADIVVREIEVIPNGREQNVVFNGRLETSVRHDVAFPAATIADSSKVFVRLYPGPLSQVIEGMDAILRMPGGCFEQTSSSTYPNVLALDYMKRTKKLTPEVRAKAEGFIANGYQRLLTFEVPGGGFSWFGQAPANKILTAYGLMEFSDMAKVYEVDPNLILRTQQWLAAQQQPDGSWKPDTNFINEGATNRYNSDLLRITAYLAWSLESTGYRGPAVEKARQYIAAHMSPKADSYTLAVLANFTRDAVPLLLNARTEKDDQVWWSAEETAVYATGPSAAVETTGLAVQALLKWGESSMVASKALAYIASKKDANGNWGTTQATIMALRAVLLSTEKGAADVRGTVQITLNGQPVETLTLTPENNDLLHQFVIKSGGAIDLRFTGKGSLAYQIVGRYFVPWNERPAHEPLSIDVTYDRTQLAQNDIATATATIKNNLPKVANMVMVDLGIPPGFDLLAEDLHADRLQKFTLTATQAMLYFDKIPASGTITLRYRLRAKYPIRARTFQSRVYEYYAPEINSVARPALLEVVR